MVKSTHFNGQPLYISIGWSVFAISGVVVISFAAMTVIWQSLRTAYANPIDSIKKRISPVKYRTHSIEDGFCIRPTFVDRLFFPKRLHF